MSLKYEISGAQIDGARDYQEDSFLITHLQAGDKEGQISLVIVADGMGGHAAGNVASNLAVQAFNKYVTTHYPSDSIPSLLKAATEEANQAIGKTIRETSALKGMGCTLVAALCINDKLYWISVGDSHLFHVQNNKLIKKNADHSYGGYLDRMAAEGNAVNEENGYSRHMLLSALTGEPIPAIDCSEQPVTLKEGDQILLCSDGIDTLDQEKIQTKCIQAETAKGLADQLLTDVDNAQRPRQDNTTVVVINVLTARSSAQVEITTKKQPPREPITPAPANTASRQSSPPPSEPRKQVVENRYRDHKSGKKLSAGWIVPFALIALLAGAGWWYFKEGRIPLPVTIDNTEEPAIATKTGNPAVEKDDKINSHEAVIRDSTVESNLQHKTVAFKDALNRGGRGPEMVWIPAGTFTMGGGSSTSPSNERPKHQVTLKKFAISSKEVTRGDYSLFSGIAVSKANRNKPVQDISWYQAQKYLRWLSKQTGKQYRLPTEAEWEYAARAGTKSPYWWGFKVGTDNALCFGCGVPLEPTRPKDVGSYKPNQFGLYDTAGNVAEWVEDCYHGDYNGAPTDGSAWITKGCKERVVRGGSYLNAPKSLIVSRRNKLEPGKSEKHIGFRIVREE